MNKKIIITGFSGFVARHFLNFINQNYIPLDVYGTDIQRPDYNYGEYGRDRIIEFTEIDLFRKDKLKAFLDRVSPDYILHLASFSSVAYSWKHPGSSFVNNTNIFLNLAEAVEELGLKCRILSIGSSEEYGNYDAKQMPLREDYMLRPCSPYAVARVSQEMLSGIFVSGYGLDIIMTRSFNHIGKWQDERFVVPSFIKKITDIKKAGKTKGTIETGNIEIVRDFVDVRDVARAYWLLLQKGVSGEVYNVCSGKGTRLADIIQLIAKEAGIEAGTRMNPELVRPEDNKIIIGSCEKITAELGWKPEISIESTIQEVMNCR